MEEVLKYMIVKLFRIYSFLKILYVAITTAVFLQSADKTAAKIIAEDQNGNHLFISNPCYSFLKCIDFDIEWLNFWIKIFKFCHATNCKISFDGKFFDGKYFNGEEIPFGRICNVVDF